MSLYELIAYRELTKLFGQVIQKKKRVFFKEDNEWNKLTFICKCSWRLTFACREVFVFIHNAIIYLIVKRLLGSVAWGNRYLVTSMWLPRLFLFFFFYEKPKRDVWAMFSLGFPSKWASFDWVMLQYNSGDSKDLHLIQFVKLLLFQIFKLAYTEISKWKY